MKTLYIYGKNPVHEVLSTRPDLVLRVYVLGSAKEPGFESLREAAAEHRIAINSVSEKKIKQLVGEKTAHQNIVAELSEFPAIPFKEWLDDLDTAGNPSVLILDEVQDVHNVGAIIRTAAASGMQAVLMPEHRQAPVTSAVFKTSAGAVMHIPIVRIGNVNQAIEKLQEKRFWVYGLAADGDTKLFDYTHDSPSAWVVGSEGAGIRPRTQELCDYRVSIPMNDQVESLNASVSAALCMYEVNRKRT